MFLNSAITDTRFFLIFVDYLLTLTAPGLTLEGQNMTSVGVRI